MSRFLLLGVALFASASAQQGAVRISGTGTSYWVNYDPHTGQNQSALTLRAGNGGTTLVMKCLPDGNMMMFVSTSVPVLPQTNVFELREKISSMYRAQVQVGNTIWKSAVRPVGYSPVQTNALRLDDEAAWHIYDALYDKKSVKIAIEAVSKAALNAQTVTGWSLFSPAGFEEALQEIEFCHMG